MRLITSAHLQPADVRALRNCDAPGEIEKLTSLFSEALRDSIALEEEILRDHFLAMCWLLAEGRLEIRIVLPLDPQGAGSGLFHSKFGIFTDRDQNQISFSGSVNETASGWAANFEEFKVFRSWLPDQKKFVESDIQTFDRYWSLGEHKSFKTISLPEAITKELIELAPEETPRLPSFKIAQQPQKIVKLRSYQDAAVGKWFESGCRGILEMATGTGKTKTATECIRRVSSGKRLVTVVTAPFEHIADQWVEDLTEFAPIKASGSTKWRESLSSELTELRLHRTDHVVVVAVQNTAASDQFIELLSSVNSPTSGIHTLLVGDEVHGLGAPSLQKALFSFAEFRLGLSATPARYFDESGTDKLIDYFGGTVYEFTTSAALAWRDPLTGTPALTPYEYHPIFVSLDAEEAQEYAELSQQIMNFQEENLEKQKLDPRLEMLLFKRSRIVKNANAKVPRLVKALNSGEIEATDCLIYCAEFAQLETVAIALRNAGVKYQKITGDESTKAEARFGGISERNWILQNFAEGLSQSLLAIKCLDEGVDIPTAKNGVILASSGNSREFIQRRGRLLRLAPGKTIAKIFDFIVAPPLTNFANSQTRQQELKIFKKELIRIDEFTRDASNSAQIQTTILRKMREITC